MFQSKDTLAKWIPKKKKKNLYIHLPTKDTLQSDLVTYTNLKVRGCRKDITCKWKF